MKQRMIAAIAPNCSASAAQVSALRLLGAAATALLLPAMLLLPGALVLPAMSVAAIAIACVLALVAWMQNTDRHAHQLTLWDKAGVFAFVGFGAAMLSEPHLVMQIADQAHMAMPAMSPSPRG